MINWAALGEPRLDGSDTRPVLFELGKRARTAPFSLQSVARPLDFEPKNKPFLSADPRGVPAGASALLQAWPEAWHMAEDMLLALYPCHDPRYVGRVGVVGGSYGCKSPAIADFGHVYASTTSVPAFVEGIVSSLANWKLYGVGFTHDAWDVGVLDLPATPVYPSPLRIGETVPAGAVVHISYCVAHILVYYRQLLTLTPVPHGAYYQIRQAHERLDRGARSVRALISGAHGGFEQFLESFLMWSDRLLAQSPETP